MHYNNFHKFADDNRRNYLRQQEQEQWEQEQRWHRSDFSYRPSGFEPRTGHQQHWEHDQHRSHHPQQHQYNQSYNNQNYNNQNYNNFPQERRFHQDDMQRRQHWPEDPYMRDQRSFHPDSRMYYNEHR